ncbi:uncharacterized protein LOC134247480 [Saccostrea cucullata]|uniref:uncharacterized protein LOC134247480 n=1 Tax=Saccostrea cuccullata TaxID=36930 RepID=UPI002ED3FFA9
MAEQLGEMKKEVLAELERVADLKQLDEKETEFLHQMVENIIKDGSDEIKKFSWLPEDMKSASDEAILTSLEQQLSREENLLLNHALHLETFTMTLEPANSPKTARFTRGGRKFLQDINLSTSDGTPTAIKKQLTSILVEIILLVMSSVGLKISYTDEQMNAVIDKVSQLLTDNIQQKIEEFVKDWPKATTVMAKAQLVFNLLKSLATGGTGLVMKIGYAIISQLSWWERMKMIAKFKVAYDNAMKNPSATIAKIAKSLTSAPGIIEKKVFNVSALKNLPQK